MKYIENADLAKLTSFLSEKVVGDLVLDGRIESFSCKPAGSDKKLSKKLEEQYVKEAAGGPHFTVTPLGSLSSASTRKLLITLISTMNASFPDYDFSSLRPDQFVHEADLSRVMMAVNASFAELSELYNSSFLSDLWTTMDKEIDLRSCQVLSYIPDMDKDPLSEGALWSFNYFFYNKDRKRIVYFTCKAMSKFRAFSAAKARAGAMDEEESTDDSLSSGHVDEEESGTEGDSLSSSQGNQWDDDELF
eukprot:CAMPEP_0196780676 /NCGR_PEP_ID=MMETSP1104-20130614/8387_1 /TAXON_ID=33652 /ORGANISM="Cafeteria sp., Strain Caron Lab Isolate" /LENGTH=247 /DNA_ID=CAMNT_0042150891 /DNA_START=40 /DNA_END=783 /DNA_ORIENTATION=+